MRIIFSTVVLSLILALPAKAADYHFITQKRESAAQQRIYMLQEIQQKKSDPRAFLNKMTAATGVKTASFKAAKNGHFYVPVQMNSRGTISFIADTGASSIFMTQTDARKIGIDVQNLNYSKVYNTANGQVRAAETKIKSLKIGDIEMTDVPVSVSSNPTGQSLLGMSFFSRLSRYGVENNTLTMYR